MSTALQHSPADIARWVLIQLGQGTDPEEADSWPIFAGGEPSLPDNCVTVYDTSPTDGGRSMIDGETLAFFGIQVRVRGRDHAAAFVKASAINRAMDESVYDTAVTIDGVAYTLHSFDKSGLIVVGKEAPTSKRSLVTVNALVSML